EGPGGPCVRHGRAAWSAAPGWFAQVRRRGSLCLGDVLRGGFESGRRELQQRGQCVERQGAVCIALDEPYFVQEGEVRDQVPGADCIVLVEVGGLINGQPVRFGGFQQGRGEQGRDHGTFTVFRAEQDHEQYGI